MSMLPKLSFPPFHFKVRDADATGMLRIWDDLRGVWIVLTPEEWVRQHLIKYLILNCGAPSMRISQEYPVQVTGMNQRADVVVTGKNAKPLLLCECKAPDVAVNPVVYAQGVRYNAVVDAKYLLITNGLSHYIYEKNKDETYSVLDEFPYLGD